MSVSPNRRMSPWVEGVLLIWHQEDSIQSRFVERMEIFDGKRSLPFSYPGLTLRHFPVWERQSAARRPSACRL